MVAIGFDINENPVTNLNDQIDNFGDNAVAAGEAGEESMNEYGTSASDTAKEVEGVANESKGFFETLSDNWGKITVGAGVAGAGIEAAGRKQAEYTEITDRSAKAIGVTSGEYRDLATDISNVTFPLEDALELMETGRQQGIDSAEGLQEYATFWDTVGDATGLAGPALGEASAGLRAVGIAAGDESDALAAFGYITENTTGEVDGFLHFLERTGPQLSEMGMDVDDAAAMLGILEHELGMSGRTARSEFRKAVNESDGDLKEMMDTLGISEEMFGEYTDAVAESSDVIQDNADNHAESYTAMEKLQHWMSELTYSYGPFIEAATMLTPLMFALGPAIKGVSFATGLFNTTLLASPITWIVLGIAALVGVVIWAYNEFEWFAEVVNLAWDYIKIGAEIAWNFIKDIIMSVIDIVVPFVMERFEVLKEFWQENSGRMLDIAINAWDMISGVLESALQFILGIFEAVWPIISGVVEIAWNLIKTYVDIGISLVTGLIDAGMSILEGDWSAAWDAIKGIAEDIWHNIEDFFSNIDLFEIGKDIIQGLINGITEMGSAVWDAVKGIGESISDGFKSFFGIASPSRLMMDYGGFIGEGLQIGMDDSAIQVARSAQSLAERGNPSAYTPEGGTSNRGGQTVYNFSPKTEIHVSGNTSPEQEQQTKRKWKRTVKEWLKEFNDEFDVREV